MRTGGLRGSVSAASSDADAPRAKRAYTGGVDDSGEASVNAAEAECVLVASEADDGLVSGEGLAVFLRIIKLFIVYSARQEEAEEEEEAEERTERQAKRSVAAF